MLFDNLFNSEVVNDQAKNYCAPIVSPEPRCEETLVLVVDLEALF